MKLSTQLRLSFVFTLTVFVSTLGLSGCPTGVHHFNLSKYIIGTWVENVSEPTPMIQNVDTITFEEDGTVSTLQYTNGVPGAAAAGTYYVRKDSIIYTLDYFKENQLRLWRLVDVEPSGEALFAKEDVIRPVPRETS
jgi:hypothetical protein